MVASLTPRDPKGHPLHSFSKNAQHPVRVLIVDDHAVVRAGVADMLASHDWLVVVGEAADGQEALAKAMKLAPDLVVVDLNLPKLSGLGLIKSLRTKVPGTQIIVLSVHQPEHVASSIIESGARGYVCKRTASTELVKALETVASGGTYFDEAFSAVVIQNCVGAQNKPRSTLSPRQREVLIGVAEGLSSKEIAARLNLGVRTVQTHREQVARRLHMRNAADFTKYAIQHGFVLIARPQSLS